MCGPLLPPVLWNKPIPSVFPAWCKLLHLHHQRHLCLRPPRTCRISTGWRATCASIFSPPTAVAAASSSKKRRSLSSGTLGWTRRQSSRMCHLLACRTLRAAWRMALLGIRRRECHRGYGDGVAILPITNLSLLSKTLDLFACPSLQPHCVSLEIPIMHCSSAWACEAHQGLPRFGNPIHPA